MKPWPAVVRLLSVSVLASLLITCGSSGGGGSTTTTEKANYPPVTTAPTWTPVDNPLVRYKAYVFKTTASDPDIGDTISKYEWDFGDGSAAVSTTVDNASHFFTTGGTYAVKVRATDSRGLVGSYTEKSVTVNNSASPISVSLVSPTGATTLKGQTGTTVSLPISIAVTTQLTGTISASGITVTPGEASAQVLPITDNGNGAFTIQIVYALGTVADANGRTVNPTIRVADSNGIQSDLLAIPPVTLIAQGANQAPVVGMTATPAIVAGDNATWQGVEITFKGTATDPDGDLMTYAWVFNDGGKGDITATADPAALTQKHTFLTPGQYNVVLGVDDGRAGGQKSVTVQVNILANQAPTLAVTRTPSTGSVYANVPYTFVATTSDPNQDAVTVTWNWGDGSAVETGNTPAPHTFTAAGPTTVLVTADDGKGGKTTSSVALNVLANLKPVLSVGTPAATLSQNKVYTFTAGGSDPDSGDSVATYEWDFDDGGPTRTSTAASIQFAYPTTVTKAAQVRVRGVDTRGAIGDWSVPVTFTVQATQLPVPTFLVPAATNLYKVKLGQTVTVAYLLSVTNPNGVPGVYLPTSAITFDPGEGTATLLPILSNGDGTYTVRATYLAATSTGTRSITPKVLVTDAQGIFSDPGTVPSVSLQTTAADNVAPMLTLSSTPEIAAGINATWKGVKVKFTGLMSDVDQDPLSYQLTFGDGGAGDITWTPSAAGTLPEFSHTYVAPGIYSVTLTVDDGHGNGQKSMTLQLNVLDNAAPALSVVSVPAANPYAYQPVTFTATTSDADGDPVSVVWDFGDLSPQVIGNSVVHTFTAVVPTTVTVTAKDGKGGITTTTVLVNVVANLPSTASVVTKPTDLEGSGILLQNKSYAFTATGVATTGNTIASYEWDFGDGTALVKGNPINHTFQPPFQGAASVRVRVIDAKGSVGDWSPAALFMVQATQMPVVTFLVPSAAATYNTETGATGVAVIYVVRVTNPNGAGFLPASALVFDPGEATATVLSKVSNGDGTYTLSVRYIPGTAGVSRNLNASAYAIDASVIRGLTVSSPIVTIATQAANRPPVVTLSSAPAVAAGTNATYQNVQVTFTATAVDPDNDTMTYSWNFGDGTTVSGLTGVSGLTQTHTYASAGAYPVTFTADDGRTAGTKSAMLTMNVLANVAPTFTPTSSNPTPYAYQRVTFTATGLTPSTATVTWNFGDGTATATGASVVHQFQAAVPTTVTAVADDGKGGITTKTLTVNVQANTPPVASVTTASATLYQNKSYTFAAIGTATTGNTVASYEWDFGDNTGVVAGTNSQAHTYATTVTGTVSVKVRAIDTKGSVGDWSPVVPFTVQATGLPVVTFVSPAAPVALSVETGGTMDYTFRIHATNPRAGQPGVTDPIPADHISFATGDALAVPGSITSIGGGDYTVTVRYQPASSPGVRTVTPSAAARDTLEIQGVSTSGPAVTVTTRSTNTAPSIYVSTPASPSSNAFTTKPVDFVFTLTDADGDPVTYTVNWGDGSTGTTAEFTGTPTGDFKAGVQVTVSHAYADSEATTTKTVTITATDGHSLNGNAVARTRSITLLANAVPTATITSPQASAITAGTSLTGTDSTADILVIPAGGKVRFAGSATTPTSGGTLTYAWSFPGGVPSSSADQNPGEVIFTGDPNSVQVYLVTFTVKDPWGRTSASAKANRKWIVVDGPNTQYFNLAFMYRLKGDNFLFNSLAPVQTAANGLGAAVQLFQDGAASTWTVQDLAGTAQAQIPVRANLTSFYVNIPSFGTDTLNYMMEIPNRPGQDSALETSSPVGVPLLPSGSSTFTFKNTTATAAPWWVPTLNIVTAQGYAAESSTSPERRIAGSPAIGWWSDTSTAPYLTLNRWVDRLAMPLTDSTVVTPTLPDGSFVLVRGLQASAEWINLVRTRELKAPVLNPDYWDLKGKNAAAHAFVLDWGTFNAPKAPSAVSVVDQLQAFRVPATSTDPYDLDAAGWGTTKVEFGQPDSTNTPDMAGSLGTLSATVPTAWNNWIYQSVASGGLSSVGIPFDFNDPNRLPQASAVTTYNADAGAFSYGEYLWSSAWARPAVLNRANIGVYHSLASFPRFYYSVPANGTTWPAKSGISPDNSAFDITPGSAGTFDASAPWAVGSAPVAGKGVGRFYWTAFVPGDGSSPFNPLPTTAGTGLSRTWIAGAAGSTTTVANQPPDSNYAPSGAGIAQSRYGFVPPIGVRLDERERDANGALLPGKNLGGYRITWYNATRDNAGNVVPPDFWVIEFADNGVKTHFLLPANYPASYPAYDPYNPSAGQKGLPFLTDARVYLPSGGTVLTPGTDTIAPGYCWFDVPLELRPSIPPSATSTITVFGLKSIARTDSLVTARPLNRTEWVDAIKTATTPVTFKPNNGVDYGYVHKIPFNYAWDIVVVQSVAAPVAR